MSLKTKLNGCKYKSQVESIIDNLTDRDIDYSNLCACGQSADRHQFIYELTDHTCKIVYQCSDGKYTIQTC